MGQDDLEVKHLKRVSRIKHEILTNYLPSWAIILGSSFSKLYYVDCFAGPGRYELDGTQVDGSPVIAVKAAKEFASKHKEKKLGVILVEEDPSHYAQLQSCLAATEPHPENLKVVAKSANSRDYIPGVIPGFRKRRSPTFFLVDPYGHPLSISVMNDILSLPKSELLINLMWFRINMDMGNEAV